MDDPAKDHTPPQRLFTEVVGWRHCLIAESLGSELRPFKDSRSFLPKVYYPRS